MQKIYTKYTYARFFQEFIFCTKTDIEGDVEIRTNTLSKQETNEDSPVQKLLGGCERILNV